MKEVKPERRSSGVVKRPLEDAGIALRSKEKQLGDILIHS